MTTAVEARQASGGDQRASDACASPGLSVGKRHGWCRPARVAPAENGIGSQLRVSAQM